MIFYGCKGQSTHSVERGVVIGDMRGTPSRYHIYYKVNQVEYRKSCMYLHLMLYTDEKCEVIYNQHNPEEAEILYWKPSFSADEKTVFTKAKINNIQKANFVSRYSNVNFTYSFGEYEFERNQTLPPNYYELYPNLHEGQQYEVECWEENLQRSIIHLDKPIKEEQR